MSIKPPVMESAKRSLSERLRIIWHNLVVRVQRVIRPIPKQQQEKNMQDLLRGK